MTPRLFNLVVGLVLIGLVWLSLAWRRRATLPRWVILVVVWVILFCCTSRRTKLACGHAGHADRQLDGISTRCGTAGRSSCRSGSYGSAAA